MCRRGVPAARGVILAAVVRDEVGPKWRRIGPVPESPEIRNFGPARGVRADRGPPPENRVFGDFGQGVQIPSSRGPSRQLPRIR